MNIQAVAQRTGVPAATLRKWEQRYGVLNPERTPGAHRRYNELDVARVEWLKARLAEGYRIGEAARLLGGATETLPTEPARVVEGLLDAAGSRSFERMGHALDQAFLLFPAETALVQVVDPALASLGRRLERADSRALVRRFLTEVARSKVRGVTGTALHGPRGSAVLACVPREEQEIELMVLAVLLHADGWGVLYLGADSPLEATADIAAAEGARLCVNATAPEHAIAAEPALRAIAERYPRLEIVRLGEGFDGDGARAVVGRLRQAVAGVV
jgi:DNA-binding transcriptional MerR regulator